MKQLECKISELELANKVIVHVQCVCLSVCVCVCPHPIMCIMQELTEHKYKSEALIHELTSKLRSTEEVSP